MSDFTMPRARQMAIQNSPEEYLPIAMYTIGCHLDKIDSDSIDGLIAVLECELRERAASKGRKVATYW